MNQIILCITCCKTNFRLLHFNPFHRSLDGELFTLTNFLAIKYVSLVILEDLNFCIILENCPCKSQENTSCILINAPGRCN